MAMAIALISVSCHKEPAVSADSLIGHWQLVSIDGDAVGTKSFSDSQGLSVWISFSSDSFDLYQKAGKEVSYSHYKGTWTLSEGTLSGKYSDGSAWASSYDVALDGEFLTLTSPTEVQKFHKEASLPELKVS